MIISVLFDAFIYMSIPFTAESWLPIICLAMNAAIFLLLIFLRRRLCVLYISDLNRINEKKNSGSFHRISDNQKKKCWISLYSWNKFWMKRKIYQNIHSLLHINNEMNNLSLLCWDYHLFGCTFHMMIHKILSILCFIAMCVFVCLSFCVCVCVFWMNVLKKNCWLFCINYDNDDQFFFRCFVVVFNQSLTLCCNTFRYWHTQTHRETKTDTHLE